MKRPAVFIDRDGTINEQMGYINDISRFIMLPGAAEAVRLLNRHQHLAIVVSNQSGVARGYFPIDLVDQIHEQMVRAFEKKGAYIDGIFYCPHYPQGVMAAYRMDCNCRKPKPGLIEKACTQFDIDLAESYVVGDRYTDIQLARELNLKSILILTGYGKGDLKYVFPRLSFKPDHVAEDLLHAVQWIVEKEK